MGTKEIELLRNRKWEERRTPQEGREEKVQEGSASSVQNMDNKCIGRVAFLAPCSKGRQRQISWGSKERFGPRKTVSFS